MRYHVYQFLDKTNNFDFLGPNFSKNWFWRQNFKNLSLDSESASLIYYVYQFLNKTDNFEYLGPNFPKTGFWGKNFKVWIRNQHPWDTMWTSFQKGQLWIFRPKFSQKWSLGSKFQKSKSGFVVSILEILCIPIFRQTGQLWIFGSKFVQKWILASEFQKSNSRFGINTTNISCVPWITWKFSSCSALLLTV